MKKLENLNSKKFEKMNLVKGGRLALVSLSTDPETGCVDNPDKCTAKDNDPCGDTASVPAP